MKIPSYPILLILSWCIATASSIAQTQLDSLMPVRGFCIKAPQPSEVEQFVTFVQEALIPNQINTLVLRVDYNYQYESRPELRDKEALSKADVKKLVAVCKTGNIRIIPQVNLFGHQSWHSELSNLLAVYPQFDETPHVELPEKYVWPNEDGLYCKSYCPLHPEVHAVVFDLVDEIIDVFEADAFHAGMDEVFYLGDDQCPRCAGRDKAELFAGEVSKIRNHLAQSDTELWIWGDRLLDGKATGLGMWEASMNRTYRAIDLIPKDVVICDWHYEKAVPTAAIFALKGFRVITCPWRKPQVAEAQVKMMHAFRENSPKGSKENYLGMMQTIWTSAENFISWYNGTKEENRERGSQVDCFKAMVQTIQALE